MFYVSKASPWPQTPRGLLFTTDSVTHFAPVSFPFPNPFPSFAYRTPLAFDFRAPVIASNCLSSLSERHSPHCTPHRSPRFVHRSSMAIAMVPALAAWAPQGPILQLYNQTPYVTSSENDAPASPSDLDVYKALSNPFSFSALRPSSDEMPFSLEEPPWMCL
jgi:hypothetical protein